MDEYRKIAMRKRGRIHYLRMKLRTLPCTSDTPVWLSRIEGLSSSRCDEDFEGRYKQLLNELTEFKRELKRELIYRRNGTAPSMTDPLKDSSRNVHIHEISDDQCQVSKTEQEATIKVVKGPAATDDRHFAEQKLYKSTLKVESPDTDDNPVSFDFVNVKEEKADEDDVGGRLEPFSLINVDNIKTEEEDVEVIERDPLALGDDDCSVLKGYIKNEVQIKDGCKTDPSVGEPFVSPYSVQKLKASASQTRLNKRNSGRKPTETMGHNSKYYSEARIWDQDTSKRSEAFLAMEGFIKSGIHQREKNKPGLLTRLINSVLTIIQKKMSYRQVTKKYKIPEQRVKSYVRAAEWLETILFNSILRTPCTLPCEFQTMLVSCCVEMKLGSMTKAQVMCNDLKRKLKMHPYILRATLPLREGNYVNNIDYFLKKLVRSKLNDFDSDLDIDCLLSP